MNKLKLQLDNLQVESFETAETHAELRGTIAANMPRPTRPEPCFNESGLVTGSCCDITLALSCIQTNCLQCNVITADTCV
ncbi:MAG TPA: pinensin family lanthipeptide [Longimicrobium sp.]|nr:pinensin family lanthipeptide [Longimicrobium sp.]